MRIGAYEIVSSLGAGGMGEVYRARDHRLGRDVAVKVLPRAFVTDVDRLARFEREARTLAALNHPHIGAIYGIEQTDNGLALILELVEGDTLAERLRRGPIAVAAALEIAHQIALALDETHERGIVHRDLKPANIKITPAQSVKVLDFGLAKLSVPAAEDVTPASAVTSAHTRDGVVLGTAAYMSPEQARGLPLDKRTDIWAFGCVLYEMLTGRPPFLGSTVSDTIAAVLTRTPDWAALPDDTPPRIREVLGQCLEKEPRRRLRDIGDVSFDARNVSSTPQSPARSRVSVGVIAVLCAAGGLITGWVLSGTPAPASAPVSRFLIDVRPATSLLGANPIERWDSARWRPSRTAIALSPDGRTLAFTAHRDGDVKLYLRPLDTAYAVAVAGSDAADGPFFSFDGGAIGYWARGALWRVPITGGPSVKVADAAQPAGAVWTPDNRIVFAEPAAVWSVDASGGTPQALVTHVEGHEGRYMLPHMLPGGRWLLYTELPNLHDFASARIVAVELATGQRKVLLEGASDARYTASGHVIFMRLGNLMAAPFNLETASLAGSEIGVIEGVMQSVGSGTIPIDTGSGQLAVSATGTLVYVAGDLHPDFEGTLQWIRRDGSVEVIPVPPPARPFFSPRLSPDGRQLAVSTLGLRNHSLWRYDFAAGTLTRLTNDGSVEHPVWSRDGRQIAVALSLGGPLNLFRLRADGTGAPQRLAKASVLQFPGGWTRDDLAIVFTSNNDLARVDLGAQPKVTPILETRFAERMVDVSPDGRSIAYVSNVSGRAEVYVRSYPELGAARLVFTEGGTEPAWSGDGRKLTFLSRHATPKGDFDRLMEWDVAKQGAIASTPRALFALEVAHYAGAIGARGYDLTANADRFIFVHEKYLPAVSRPHEIHVVVNWFEDLKRRVR